MAVKLYDYRCLKCSWHGELFAESDEKTIPCECGGIRERVWTRFGGMMNKSKGLYPYFDSFLGQTINSPQHREQVAKSQGLCVISKEEEKRTKNGQHLPDQDSVLPESFIASAVDEAIGHATQVANGNLPAPEPESLPENLPAMNESNTTLAEVKV